MPNAVLVCAHRSIAWKACETQGMYLLAVLHKASFIWSAVSQLAHCKSKMCREIRDSLEENNETNVRLFLDGRSD